MKEKIRPIYSELQGYMSQASTLDHSTTDDETLWQQFNKTIDELNTVSEKDYDKFKVKNIVHRQDASYRLAHPSFIEVSEYRSKLGGLIARLHGEYFSDELAPFSGMPQTIINQNQNQTQSISVILEIQEKIISQLPKYKDGSNEKKFLEKVKSALSGLKGTVDVMSTILKIGADFGLLAQDIHKILGL